MDTNLHHRRERQHGGTTRKPVNNIIRVPVKHHVAYNMLFHNRTPDGIAKTLTDIWIDPEYVMIAVPRKRLRQLQEFLKQIDI